MSNTEFGDLNGDGKINQDDLDILISGWGTTYSLKDLNRLLRGWLTEKKLESTANSSESSASTTLVVNDPGVFVKEGDVIAINDSSDETNIISEESVRISKNNPPLPNEPSMISVVINSDVVSRQYSQINNNEVSISLQDGGVSGNNIEYEIMSGQNILGTAEINDNIMTYTASNDYNEDDTIKDEFYYTVTNGTDLKYMRIEIILEPKYYFGGNIGLNESISGAIFRYWDIETKRSYKMISTNKDIINISPDSIIGSFNDPVICTLD